MNKEETFSYRWLKYGELIEWNFQPRLRVVVIALSGLRNKISRSRETAVTFMTDTLGIIRNTVRALGVIATNEIARVTSHSSAKYSLRTVNSYGSVQSADI